MVKYLAGISNMFAGISNSSIAIIIIIFLCARSLVLHVLCFSMFMRGYKNWCKLFSLKWILIFKNIVLLLILLLHKI